MPRPERGFAAARLFRWQTGPISLGFGDEFRGEPLSKKDGDVLRPVSSLRGTLGHWHRGVDLPLSVGTLIRLILSGVISIPLLDPGGFGNAVQCDGARYRMTYGHLSVIRVPSGKNAFHGDLIGLSGSSGNSTGPHIHVELFDKGPGVWIDPWSAV